jgi:hypothetical protein
MKQMFYAGLLLLGLFTVSCNFNELSDTKLAPISPEWAIPLVDDTLKVEDILIRSTEEGAVKNFSSGLYYFVYTSELVGPAMEEAVVVADTTASFTNTQTLPAVSTGQSITLPRQSFDLGLRNLVLKEMLFKAGSLGLRVNLVNNAGTRVSANIVYRFDSIRNGNTPLSLSSFFGNGVNSSLVNYRFTNKGSNSITKFYVTPSITANQALPAGNYTIQTELSFNGLKFSYADVIATNLIPLQPITKNIRIKLFDNRYEDDKNDIRFEDPSVQIVVSNGFGGDPISMRITNIKSFSDDRNIARLLTGSGVTALGNQAIPGANVNFAAPSVTRSGIFSDTLDRTNTNINDIIQFYNPAPKFVSFDARAITNNAVARVIGADTSRFRLRTNAILPTDGAANSYALADTFELNDLPKNNADQTIEEAKFKLVFYNQFPVNMVGNLLFFDANNNLIDSLAVRESNGTFNNVLAIAAQPGGAPEFRVPSTAATKNERLFTVSKTRYNNIQSKAVKGVLRAKLSSYQDQSNATRPRARIYSDYAIRVKVGVSAKVTLNL